jgi:hypothetical protein
MNIKVPVFHSWYRDTCLFVMLLAHHFILKKEKISKNNTLM